MSVLRRECPGRWKHRPCGGAVLKRGAGPGPLMEADARSGSSWEMGALLAYLDFLDFFFIVVKVT